MLTLLTHLYGLPPDFMPPVAYTIEPTQPMVEVLIPTNQPVYFMPPVNHKMTRVIEGVPTTCSNEQLQMLEERLKAIEGSNYGMVEAADLCSIPDVIIHPKFKAPEFDKYKGTSCPKSRLSIYFRKMEAHARDGKLLIHCFQDSLTGAALKCYMQLERAHIRSWKDLGDVFIRKYKYNIDLTPNGFELQSMSKKEYEAFKAQRWRVVAAQVEPPLSEKETTTLFIDTLCEPFYDK